MIEDLDIKLYENQLSIRAYWSDRSNIVATFSKYFWLIIRKQRLEGEDNKEESRHYQDYEVSPVPFSSPFILVLYCCAFSFSSVQYRFWLLFVIYSRIFVISHRNLFIIGTSRITDSDTKIEGLAWEIRISNDLKPLDFAIFIKNVFDPFVFAIKYFHVQLLIGSCPELLIFFFIW